MDEAQRQLREALAAEGRAYRALLEGRPAAADLAAARDAYVASYRAARPGSWGRLLGAMKAAVLGGGAADEVAALARAEAGAGETPPAAYVRVLADAVLDEPPPAAALARMEDAGAPFATVARALAALAGGDAAAYAGAARELLADFESRDAFLTGVPFADTVAALERLADRRGIAARLASPLLPG